MALGIDTKKAAIFRTGIFVWLGMLEDEQDNLSINGLTALSNLRDDIEAIFSQESSVLGTPSSLERK